VALESRDTLQASVDRVLENNQELHASLMGAIAGGTTTFNLDSRPISRSASIAHSTKTISLLSRPFENVLYKTRVYSRIKQTNDCDKSLHTDLVSTHLGSTYTGMTLDRISTIAVVALPLPLSSIINTQWYAQRKLCKADESSETGQTWSTNSGDFRIAIVGEAATGKSALAFRVSRPLFVIFGC
jgi:hypothetical protein